MSEDVKEALAKLNIERSEASQLIADKAKADQPPFVIFMTPSIDHMVTLGFLKSFYESAIVLANAGVGCAFQSFGGDPYLAKVRNLLVSTCLRRFPQATDFFFLDADLEWDANAVLRMVRNPEPIVAGIYPKKNDIHEFPCALRLLEGEKPIERDGMILADMVPTGFLRVKRHVYEAMAKVSPRYKDGTGGDEICWNIFEMGFDASRMNEQENLGDWWGEDYAWCRRADAMGYEIWIDPDIQFGHRGGKTWRNNFNYSVQALRDGTIKIAPPAADPSPAVAVEPGLPAGEVLSQPVAPLADAVDPDLQEEWDRREEEELAAKAAD